MLETSQLALALVAAGALLVLSALVSRASGRLGLPISLLFLGLGMLAGSDGLGGIVFSDFGLAFRLGTVALVLILFDGGLNTPASSFQHGLRPAVVLATLGVLGTALVLAGVAHLLGFTPLQSLLLGSIVSSTDAAAVFAALRNSGIHLKRRLGATLELESGLNDPMAVILTTAVTTLALQSGEGAGVAYGALALEVLVQLAVGAGLGWVLGLGGRWLLKRVRLPAAGLYPVLTLALALLAFGVPTLLHGSGFLAVYVLGMMLGNARLRYRAGLLRVHDALAWLSQVGMFLVLGLLVYPRQLPSVAGDGLALGLALAFVARPTVVALLLLPFRLPWREVLYAGWVGLRGAVPIILATIPVLAGVHGGPVIFHVVFFIVVVNALVPGATVPWLTHRLGLAAKVPAPPPAVMEIASTQLLDGEVHSFHVDAASAVCGARISELPFPEESAATLLVRGTHLIAPRGDTQLAAGDHLFVFCRNEDLPFVQLMLGTPQDE